jgi:hypothetical protein
MTGTVGARGGAQNGVFTIMGDSNTPPPDPPDPPNGTILALAELAEHLDRKRSLAEASTAIAEFAVAQLDSDLAGVFLLRTNGRPRRLAATSSVLVQLDEVEARGNQGPGLAPVADGAVINVADTRGDHLWPEWSSAAAERDILSACFLGMPPLRGRAVALQLFSRRTAAFAPENLSGFAAVAKVAGMGLRQVDRLANLEEAMATRDLIGQAQGILMERYELNSDQAMHYLRRSSQEANAKVRDIAQELVSPSAPDA